MHLTIRLASVAFLALLLPARGTPPAWWHAGDAPVIDPAAPPNNHGPANLGQAKHTVTSALLSLDSIAPQISAAVRTELAGSQPDHSDRTVDLEVPDPKTPEWLEKQQAPLLLGQLKAIAAPFYETLHDVAPAWLDHESADPATRGQLQLNGTKDPDALSNFYPWSAHTTDNSNHSIATIGQLKAVFSLRFETDADINGLPDLWEINHFAHTGVDPKGDADGDGITNLNEYLNGTDPTSPNGPGTGLDLDGDGWLDGNEIQAGGNPTVKDNPKVMLQVVAY
jgi:hypothetical protein